MHKGYHADTNPLGSSRKFARGIVLLTLYLVCAPGNIIVPTLVKALAIVLSQLIADANCAAGPFGGIGNSTRGLILSSLLARELVFMAADFPVLRNHKSKSMLAPSASKVSGLFIVISVGSIPTNGRLSAINSSSCLLVTSVPSLIGV